ncbi:Sorting nexin-6 [Trichoplax sp. H2]|nr:Sorting nexin-6 [Trichoplax sp. H2]|eukprot:RDD44836.1 Sorting nexin-6 [Trichoplax sp. H2]
MMEGADDIDLNADGMEEVHQISKDDRSQTIDLSSEACLVIEISDALSERDKVKFTIHTRTTLPEFKLHDFSVTRDHEEFIWLYDRYQDNENLEAYIIPHPPPKPDFDTAREKLQRLGESEGVLTKEEFDKMKQELEAEYLATFKKTVAMHELFLTRLASHSVLRNDSNFRVFLEYNGDLNVRLKNRKEKLGSFFKVLTKSVDEDADDFFENEKRFLVDYHTRVKEALKASDKMTISHKGTAGCYLSIGSATNQMGTSEPTSLNKFLSRFGGLIEKYRKIDNRVVADEDLKLSDILRYYARDLSSAKDLLYRRSRCVSSYENANKGLEKARNKNKDVQTAEKVQQAAREKFENMSEIAKQELLDFKQKRVTAFKRNLSELAELELKHAKIAAQLFRNTISALKEIA